MYMIDAAWALRPSRPGRHAAHKGASIWHLAIECGLREVKARVLRAEPFQHEALLLGLLLVS